MKRRLKGWQKLWQSQGGSSTLGLLIKPEHASFADTEVVCPSGQNSHFDIDELQGYVGGYFELAQIRAIIGTDVRTRGNIDVEGIVYSMLLVNDNGISDDLPFNAVASAVHGSAIVGNALLLQHFEMD